MTGFSFVTVGALLVLLLFRLIIVCDLGQIPKVAFAPFIVQQISV